MFDGRAKAGALSSRDVDGAGFMRVLVETLPTTPGLQQTTALFASFGVLAALVCSLLARESAGVVMMPGNKRTGPGFRER